MSPFPQSRAIRVIQAPDPEASQKDTKAESYENPHSLKDVGIPAILAFLLRLRSFSGPRFGLILVLLAPPTSEVRPQVHLHHIHTSEKDHRSQNRIGVLVKAWVLQIMIVSGDEDGQ